jgi:hypothetical protein
MSDLDEEIRDALLDADSSKKAKKKPKKGAAIAPAGDSRAQLLALGLQARATQKQAMKLAGKIRKEEEEAAVGLAHLGIDPRLAGLSPVDIDAEGNILRRDDATTRLLPRGDLPDEGIKKPYTDDQVLTHARANDGATPKDIEWAPGQLDKLLPELNRIKKPKRLWQRS